jgi:hypothetical protein
LAPTRAALAEYSWGSIRCDGLPARLGAHLEADCLRSCASFPPKVLLPCRYCASSGYTPNRVVTRKSPSYFARRLATAGLKLAAGTMTRIRLIQCGTRGRFAPTPALWGASSAYRPVRAMAFRRCSKCCQLFRVFRERALFVRGMIYPFFLVNLSS